MKARSIKKEPVGEPQLFQALLKKYPVPEYALFPQVPDGTGLNKWRTADAISISLWPSRGIVISGFELKSHRGDWLKELRTPEKAEGIARYCDFWWVVASDDFVVKVEEVPDTWGLLVLKKNGLRAVKHAKEMKPEALDRLFVAGLLRRAQKVLVDTEALEVAEERGYERGKKDGADIRVADRDLNHREHEQLKKSVQAFQEKSGVEIAYWDGGRIGEAVRRVMAGDDAMRTLKMAIREVARAHKQLEEAAK